MDANERGVNEQYERKTHEGLERSYRPAKERKHELQVSSERAFAVPSGTLLAQKGGAETRRTRARRPMSATAQKALSQRMKAYWARQRGATAIEKPKAQA